MNLFPLFIANFAPKKPPTALQTAMGVAINQMIFPLMMNKQIEPKLVAKFTIFALAEA